MKRVSIVLIVLTFLASGCVTQRSTTTLSGEVVVSADIVVEAGQHLRIAAGSHLQFMPNTGIVVRGGILSIEGMAGKPVLLDDYVEGWLGIQIESGYAEIRHGCFSGVIMQSSPDRDREKYYYGEFSAFYADEPPMICVIECKEGAVRLKDVVFRNIESDCLVHSESEIRSDVYGMLVRDCTLSAIIVGQFLVKNLDVDDIEVVGQKCTWDLNSEHVDQKSIYEMVDEDNRIRVDEYSQGGNLLDDVVLERSCIRMRELREGVFIGAISINDCYIENVKLIHSDISNSKIINCMIDGITVNSTIECTYDILVKMTYTNLFHEKDYFEKTRNCEFWVKVYEILNFDAKWKRFGRHVALNRPGAMDDYKLISNLYKNNKVYFNLARTKYPDINDFAVLDIIRGMKQARGYWYTPNE